MDIVFWLWLLNAPQLGVKTFYSALKVFESPQAIFDANILSLRESGAFAKKTLDYLAQKDLNAVDNDLDWANGDRCHIISLVDPAYPKPLAQISDPPPLLYVLGSVDVLSKPQLGVVGSRNPTAGGKLITKELSTSLSLSGLVITSGMATGIDGEAHIAALETGGETIAVCGTGLDRIYPAKHRALAHQISEQGALVSEFSIGTMPMAQNFPRRNRLISGMSLGVLVVEASIKSGSMITARLALEQGREVFAVPGSIHSPLSTGPHELLKQGAVLTRNAEDLLNELSFESEPCIPLIKQYNGDKDVDNEISELLKFLSYEAISVDELVEKSKLSPQVVSQTLLMLELSNRVSKVGVATFVLI
ncbi:MAG TPA: DNA-protecting protein DprA [Candidatus Thioglobus sp.]|nr:DNA-protecting protein DprA [Candidatus Thioglobus sp.]HIL20276.1 DNA-protecting protein DprA [Candidatus Thioglobus sp.]